MSRVRRMPALPKVPGRRANKARWTAACNGTLPAEALPTRDREDLVYDLHQLGWSDVEIAEYTRMTTYTTARIRSRLGLEPQAAKLTDAKEAA